VSEPRPRPGNRGRQSYGIPEECMYWTELTRIKYINLHIYGFEESVRIEV
jgi:hypothetical protein